jgi:hypothetical protein
MLPRAALAEAAAVQLPSAAARHTALRHRGRVRGDPPGDRDGSQSAGAAMNILIWTAVVLIGGTGSVARFLLDGAISARRRVPAVTIVVDTPERIATAYSVIDELTAQQGLVTSETVPAIRATAVSRAA